MTDEPTVPKIIDKHDVARACRFVEAYTNGRGFDGKEHPEHERVVRAVCAALAHEFRFEPPSKLQSEVRAMTVLGFSIEQIRALARFFTEQTGRPPEQILEYIAAAKRG